MADQHDKRLASRGASPPAPLASAPSHPGLLVFRQDGQGSQRDADHFRSPSSMVAGVKSAWPTMRLSSPPPARRSPGTPLAARSRSQLLPSAESFEIHLIDLCFVTTTFVANGYHLLLSSWSVRRRSQARRHPAHCTHRCRAPISRVAQAAVPVLIIWISRTGEIRFLVRIDREPVNTWAIRSNGHIRLDNRGIVL